ncbi:antitoxin VbhA family protein [Hoyosella altamirensis]|uniref:Antitoxin VbhA domain-containing protein n=1 Tax=Hoyosella altamirensis TaxID=616997 RepID=A0A839RQ03_9ACTN|nr:antitoxin VbhA family protein [Hoyosella altamirensis]MBB3038194.1 hypothetical protein [Hoyosella altamirensis]
MAIEHSISAAERAQRVRRYAAARHSAELEGGYIATDKQQPFDDYVEGRIDENELVRRVRQACGLPAEE